MSAAMPTHRKILLWMSVAPILYCAAQVGMRLWLLKAGDEVVGVVTIVTDTCRTRHLSNCYLGRAIVDPRNYRYNKTKVTKISGGRFYTVGQELPMRIYPAQRVYLAQVYDLTNWIIGPVRTAVIALLLLLAAAMPAKPKVLWILPLVLVVFLTMS